MASGAPNQQIYVRHSIWTLESANISQDGTPWDPVSLYYAYAVREMQGRPTDNPTSWMYQANMHGTYDPNPQPDWNGCQHASWFFLPWHRMYIYWFEQIIRTIVIEQGGPDDWALPYWNYSNGFPSNTLPPAFREQTLPDGSPNPLLVPDPHRNPNPPPGINGGNQLPTWAVDPSQAFNTINFVPPPPPGFGGGPSTAMQFENATGALENVPHNVVHGLVGGATSSGNDCNVGWMSDPMCAAQDPIFWLHHSNIDRLWSHWLQQGGGRSNPTDSNWLNQQWSFYNPSGGQETMTIDGILDPTETSLGYRYDDSPPPVAQHLTAAAATPAPSGGNPPRVLAASQAPLQLAGQPTTVSVDLPGEVQTVAQRVAAAPAEAPRMQLNVEDIRIDRDPGIVYEIYLNLPEANETTDPHTEHFVGYVTFFGATHHHSPDHQPTGIKHSYDITNLVHALSASGKWDESKVTVTFVPRGLLPPPGRPAVAAAETAAIPTAQIGRVTLTSE